MRIRRPCQPLASAFLALLTLACTGVAPAASESRDPAKTKLIFLAWDGVPDRVIDRLLAEGAMPHLAALARRGARADYSVTTFPSKTAAGHAALWTGCGPACNGVVANGVPELGEGGVLPDLLSSRRGFSSEVLTAEPIYLTAAKAGRSVAVLSATQSYPETPHVAALAAAGPGVGEYRSFSGFEHQIARGDVLDAAAFSVPSSPWAGVAPELVDSTLEATLTVGDSKIYVLAFDDPNDPTVGFDSLRIRPNDRSVVGKQEEVIKPMAASAEPRGWSRPYRVRRGDRVGNTFLRLFELAPDGSTIALHQREASGLKGAASAEEIERYMEAYPGFHDSPIYDYERGAFGAPLMAGGDGTAEERALELVAFDLQLAAGGLAFALDEWQPDLLLHYSPMADQAGHVWTAVFDESLPGHDAQVAARVWPYYVRVLELLDGWLGSVVEAAGDDTLIAIASDHGMAAAIKDFYPNNALEAAGLVKRDDKGRIDLARTQVMMPRFGSFGINVNLRGRWRGGNVDEADREAVLAKAAAALLAARDPETGEPVVSRLFWPDREPGLGLGGPRSGDLYFDLMPGYYVRGGLGPAVAAPTRTAWGGGEHGYWPERRDMHAIFYLAGPGVRAGVELPPVRHIDVAPTLSYLLGIPAPAQAEGRIIAEALAELAQ